MRLNVKPIVAVAVITLATSAFAAMGAKDKPAPKAGTCGPIADSRLDRVMNDNSPSGRASSCWSDHVSISGSTLLAYQRTDDVNGDNDTFFNVRSLSVYLDAAISKSIAAHIALNAESALVNNMPAGTTLGALDIEEAYLTMSNFMKSPMFLKAGRSFTSFGVYKDPNPAVFSINQSFVQSNNTNVALGFASNAGYSLQGFVYEDEASSDWDQFGLTLGYKGDLMGAAKGLDFGMKVSYVDNYASLVSGGDVQGLSLNEESAYNVSAGMKVRDFKLGMSFFKVSGDLLSATSTNAVTTVTTTAAVADTKPSVISFNAAYDFKLVGRNADLHLGYEKVKHAEDLDPVILGLAGNYAGVPEKHTSAGVGVKLAKHANAALDYHKFDGFGDTGSQKQYVAQVKVMF